MKADVYELTTTEPAEASIMELDETAIN